MNLKPVLFVLGIILCTVAVGMVLPMIVDLQAGYNDWQVFATCIAFTGFFGGAFILTNSSQDESFSLRQVFLLTTLAWIAMALFSALPFMFCELRLSFVDALFEAMSGVTTTGSTVITGLDSAPPGILLWRASIQWFGGIGIILMAMSVLPFLNVGGMQIFKNELSESEKALPRTAQLASAIGAIYLGITFVCVLAYMASGMSGFNAIAHAMTTISTGGFSTFDTSFSGHANSMAEIVAIIFMLSGALPFILYLKAVRGNVSAFLNDSQVRFFLTTIFIVTAAIATYLIFSNVNMNPYEALLQSTFNVVSIITGTGFVNGDYGQWGQFPMILLFFLTVVGGCAGSTSCGIKIFRIQVLISVAAVQLKKLIHPHGVFSARYNNKKIPDDVPMSVMSFFFLFVLSFSAIALSLSLVGLDFITSMTGAATVIGNVGPGFGDIIGPTGTFQPLPDSAKLILTVGMLLGRLEILTVLVLFVPRFWSR